MEGNNISNRNDFQPYKKKESQRSIFKILGEVFSLLILLLYFLGSYHSCTKHKDDADWQRYSPYALYRGIEFFWHDDFAGVNWDKRIKGDVEICVKLLARSISENLNIHDLNRDIEKFSKELSRYPKEKLEIIKKGTQLYIKLIESTYKDCEIALKNFKFVDTFFITLSAKTKEMQAELVQYLSKETIEAVTNAYKYVDEYVNNKIDNGDIKIDNETINRFKYIWSEVSTTFNNTYKKIFNE